MICTIQWLFMPRYGLKTASPHRSVAILDIARQLFFAIKPMRRHYSHCKTSHQSDNLTSKIRFRTILKQTGGHKRGANTRSGNGPKRIFTRQLQSCVFHHRCTKRRDLQAAPMSNVNFHRKSWRTCTRHLNVWCRKSSTRLIYYTSFFLQTISQQSIPLAASATSRARDASRVSSSRST